MSAKSIPENSKMLFWQTGVRKGANVFNRKVDSDLIKAAKEYKIGFIRLAPDKFETTQRDFLLGNADNYPGLISKDLKVLKDVLDAFHQQKIPVVLTMLSLPGSRWKQNNNDKDDLRLWSDQAFQKQAAKFWQDLAKELKDHPAIVGYNILNEPHPERLYNTADSAIYNVEQSKVQKNLFGFYSSVVNSIRQVDSETPIILDSSSYADSNTFNKFEPVSDKNVLYSFHIYEPFAYTNLKLNQGNFAYPGHVQSFDAKKVEYWNKDKLKSYIEPVKIFQKRYNIPDYKILAGEFGGHRCSKGLEHYFRDLTSIFNEYNWHFAVYGFREDIWDGMDYELGSKKLSWKDWQAIEEGRMKKNYLPNNSIFKILREEWSSQLAGHSS
ncbi:MAG: glycoside hydrolase family 5 protein [Wolbachia sp.]